MPHLPNGLFREIKLLVQSHSAINWQSVYLKISVCDFFAPYTFLIKINAQMRQLYWT